jgi:hypothetical protein
MLRWDQAKLSQVSKVSTATIKRLEAQSGFIDANHATVDTIRGCLEAAGIEFLDGEQPGVRFKLGFSPSA